MDDKPDPGDISSAIREIRDGLVILDGDLARFYGQSTGALNQAVSRNVERFPANFMFELTEREFASLRSQNVISRSWGGRRFLREEYSWTGTEFSSTPSVQTHYVYGRLECGFGTGRTELQGGEEDLSLGPGPQRITPECGGTRKRFPNEGNLVDGHKYDIIAHWEALYYEDGSF